MYYLTVPVDEESRPGHSGVPRLWPPRGCHLGIGQDYQHLKTWCKWLLAALSSSCAVAHRFPSVSCHRATHNVAAGFIRANRCEQDRSQSFIFTWSWTWHPVILATLCSLEMSSSHSRGRDHTGAWIRGGWGPQGPWQKVPTTQGDTDPAEDGRRSRAGRRNILALPFSHLLISYRSPTGRRVVEMQFRGNAVLRTAEQGKGRGGSQIRLVTDRHSMLLYFLM